MSTFSLVYKPYTFGGGRGLKFRTLLTFWPDFFYYFHGNSWHSKNVDVYYFFWRGLKGWGFQKVYGLSTHENVDICGQPFTSTHPMDK